MAVEKVVYVLGAGFSAPAGIPVIGNFLEKAKDQYFKDPKRYSSFREIFDTIDKIAKAKTYINVDLLNIEEILSVLAMDNAVSETEEETLAFRNFVSEVIQYYTPDLQPLRVPIQDNWWDVVMGNRLYGAFVASTLGLRLIGDRQPKSLALSWVIPEASTEYSIVTLNYDEMLSAPLNMLSENAGPQESPLLRPGISYLHGSVERGDIVPPTWTKELAPQLKADWASAAKALEKANHIRFLGYSFPTSDLYVKYLLTRSVQHASHLKTIDVICLDPNGDVQQRYAEHFCYRNLRFMSGDLTQYLRMCEREKSTKIEGAWYVVTFDGLERAHRRFMAGHTE